MIVALLLLIVAILLFGAGVVRGWLLNATGYVCGGFVLLVLGAYASSYLGHYGPLWIIGAIAGLLASTVAIEDYVRKRAHQKMLAGMREGNPEQQKSLAANAIWTKYVYDIRERFNPVAQNRARALYGALDALGLERFCRAEIDRLNQRTSE